MSAQGMCVCVNSALLLLLHSHYINYLLMELAVLVHNFVQSHLPSFNSKVTHPCLLRRTEIQSSLKLLRNDLLTFMFLDQ